MQPFIHIGTLLGLNPGSQSQSQSVVPSITFIVHNDWWFIVVYVIYSLPAVYFGLSAAIHLKSHLQLPLLSNKNKRSSKLLHGMHCVCGYSSFRLNVLLIPVSQVHTQVYVLGNLINVNQFFFQYKVSSQGPALFIWQSHSSKEGQLFTFWIATEKPRKVSYMINFEHMKRFERSLFKWTFKTTLKTEKSLDGKKRLKSLLKPMK